jgi:TonB family protein
MLWVAITQEGTTRDIKITQALTPELDAKAFEAVSKWKFAPAMREGRPVAVLISVQVDFQRR